jgi:hypothetical protein
MKEKSEKTVNKIPSYSPLEDLGKPGLTFFGESLSDINQTERIINGEEQFDEQDARDRAEAEMYNNT